MARALSIPAARVAPNLTLLVWGGITLLGSLLLPWFREGRDLYTFLPEAVGLTLLSRSALIGAVAATALIAAAIGVIPRGNADRGRAAAVVGGVGSILAIAQLLTAGRPLPSSEFSRCSARGWRWRGFCGATPSSRAASSGCPPSSLCSSSSRSGRSCRPASSCRGA